MYMKRINPKYTNATKITMRVSIETLCGSFEDDIKQRIRDKLATSLIPNWEWDESSEAIIDEVYEAVLEEVFLRRKRK